MANDPTNQSSYSFGDFRVDSVERVLMRKGELVPLTAKVFDLLLLLVENHGHIVGKERLMNEVWPDTFVEEGNLTQNISVLRKALGNSTNGSQYIQTIPRRGYRFVGNVTVVLPSVEELVVEEHSRARIVIDEREVSSDVTALPTASASPTAPKTLTRGILLAAGAGLCVLLLAALVWNWLRKPPLSLPPAQVNVIGVLPLKSLEQSADDQYLQLGIADDLINKLSSMKEVVVRPTSAVRQYSDPLQDPVYLTYLAYAAELQGKHAQALALARELEEKYRKSEAQGYDLAIFYAGTGDKERAFAWLEKNFETRGAQLTTITVEPVFDSLRGDPRFSGLLERMGIPH